MTRSSLSQINRASKVNILGDHIKVHRPSSHLRFPCSRMIGRPTYFPSVQDFVSWFPLQSWYPLYSRVEGRKLCKASFPKDPMLKQITTGIQISSSVVEWHNCFTVFFHHMKFFFHYWVVLFKENIMYETFVGVLWQIRKYFLDFSFFWYIYSLLYFENS